MKQSPRTVRLISGAVLSILAVVGALTISEPANAWGERAAIRDCGTNWIQSWATPGGGRAETIKLRGDCGGRLQAGLRRSTGSPYWVEGSNSFARADRSGYWVGGLHRGCYECGTSYT